jgi:hypothetical protein
MFNPTELTFEGIVETADNPGARTQSQGKPKVSFSNVKAYKITISKILFDTYEEGSDVVKKYIVPFRKAVEFVEGKQRPPIYMFTWGQQQYLRSCFVEKLTYKLTLFLPDGTPVRALIDSLTLKEVEPPKPDASLKTSAPSASDRQTDTPANRQRRKARR